jgi:hypothetical protein
VWRSRAVFFENLEDPPSQSLPPSLGFGETRRRGKRPKRFWHRLGCVGSAGALACKWLAPRQPHSAFDLLPTDIEAGEAEPTGEGAGWGHAEARALPKSYGEVPPNTGQYRLIPPNSAFKNKNHAGRLRDFHASRPNRGNFESC